MQLNSLYNSIQRGVLPPVYLFYGEEDFLFAEAVSALKQHLLDPGTAAFNLDELDGEKASPTSVAEAAVTLPVFAEKRLVLVRNPVFFQSGKKEKEKEKDKGKDKEEEESTGFAEQALLKYLADPLLSTCLVFLLKGSADKRRKLYKAVEKAGTVIELGPLKGEELTNWIREQVRKLGKTIEPRALEYIVLHADPALSNLRNELEKIALYLGDEKAITLSAAEKLVVKSSEANIFALVDNLGFRKAEGALLELKNLLENGEPPVRILFMIARHLRLLLAAKELQQRGYTEKQITAELAQHPFVTGKLLREGRSFSFAALERSLSLALECDLALKSGMAPRLALEDLILKLEDCS